MRQAVDILSIPARGRGLVEITRDVLNWLKPHTVQAGLLTLFCRHTSAGLLIQENAARDVRVDLETFFDRLAPEDASRYRHADEGPDDMPAHIRTDWRFRSCRGSSPWELGKVFTCSSIGARRIGDRLPCILLVNDGGRVDHRSKARSLVAVLAKSRSANAFRFLWMKLQ
jgi:secondary thiamine-phosphate synthase enzyme